MSASKVSGLDGHHLDRVGEYIERVARECLGCREDVRRLISLRAENNALAEEAVDITVQRVTEYAMRHGLEREIRDVKGFCVTTAYRVLFDAQSKKLKSDKVDTVSWDDERHAELLNHAADSSARQIEESLEINESLEIYFRGAPEEQKQLFDMLHRDGLKAEDIAACLHIKVATARYRIRKLNAALQSMLSGQAGRQ